MESCLELTSGGFVVETAEDFPRILGYRLDGKSIPGCLRPLDSFRVNGVSYAASTRKTDIGTDWVLFSSRILDPVWDGLEIRTSIRVEDVAGRLGDPAFGVARFRIDEILGAKESLVHTIGIPGHALLSVAPEDGPAHLARTLIDTDPARNADELIDVRAATEQDLGEVPAAYAFAWNGELAGGVHSNATPEFAANEVHTNHRLLTRITAEGERGTCAGISSGDWVWAPRDGFDRRVSRYCAPECTVVVARAAEGKEIGWMGAARALRQVLPRPLGADRVPERVAQRIPFNFGSEATNPFLKTFDNVKRVALATDGLGQWVLLKGYGSEGHDSANSDYGSHFNTAAGGLGDLNLLIEGAKRYNTDVAVHINATEIYPAARAYSDALTNGARTPAWDWLGQSYETVQEADFGQGLVINRLESLRAEAPHLDGVYIDAYYRAGWVAEGLAGSLRELGLELGSEYSYAFEGSSIWSHWANDVGYSTEAENVGINSAMLRYMFNTDRDVWNADPLLGGVHMSDFEGWTGKQDWADFCQFLWTDNVPTKFLQHFRILDWVPGVYANLEGGVEVRLEDGVRVIHQDGVEIARGGTYLLPWPSRTDLATDGVAGSEKMYFHSDTDGTWRFRLTHSFSGVDTLSQYRLTDLGREWVADVDVIDGCVTLNSRAHDAHVLLAAGTPSPVGDIAWGEGSHVIDPGFCSGTLLAWNTEGDVDVERDFTGDHIARLGPDESGISQLIRGLRAGERHAFTASVEIGAGGRRQVCLTVTGQGVDEVNWFETTPARNTTASDPKHGSHMNRACLDFVAPADGVVRIGIRAREGSQPVRVDDLRVQEIEDLAGRFPLEPRPASLVGPEARQKGCFWDFEDSHPGCGPFVRGDAGKAEDGRTSITEMHFPYTQREWKNQHLPFCEPPLVEMGIDDVLSGSRSLKSHDEREGVVYRTIPSLMWFRSGTDHRVSFSFQCSLPGTYEWILGADDVASGTERVLEILPIPCTHATERFVHEFRADSEDYWVGLRRVGTRAGADFVLDDLLVETLSTSASTRTGR